MFNNNELIQIIKMIENESKTLHTKMHICSSDYELEPLIKELALLKSIESKTERLILKQ